MDTVHHDAGVNGEAGEILGALKQSNSPVEAIARLQAIGCAGACLGIRSGRGVFPRIQTQRIRKTERLLSPVTGPAAIVDLAKDIAKLARVAAAWGMKPTVRLNGTSDLLWLADPRLTLSPSQARAARVEFPAGSERASLPALFPGVQFYDYTKRPHLMREFLQGRLPGNIHVTFSYSGHNWDACQDFLRAGGTVSVPFHVRKGISLPLFWRGWPVVDGDVTDLRGLDSPGVIVGLRAKGRSAKMDTDFLVHDPRPALGVIPRPL
jgi:hypothetical protein